mgnify:CR=1 FL=1
MNHKAYDHLPEDLPAILDAHSALRLADWIGATMDASDAPARNIAGEGGNAIISIEGEARAAWPEAGARVRASWVKAMTAAGVDCAMLISMAERLAVDELATQEASGSMT